MEIKFSKMIIFLIMLIITQLTVSACGNVQNTKLVNEQSFSSEHIKDLSISYDEEEINFFISKDKNITIKEYMSKDKKRYHAKIRADKKSIQIHEGKKPFSKGGFTRYVEIYLPESYSENLMVTTTDGNIEVNQ